MFAIKISHYNLDKVELSRADIHRHVPLTKRNNTAFWFRTPTPPVFAVFTVRHWRNEMQQSDAILWQKLLFAMMCCAQTAAEDESMFQETVHFVSTDSVAQTGTIPYFFVRSRKIRCGIFVRGPHLFAKLNPLRMWYVRFLFGCFVVCVVVCCRCCLGMYSLFV